MTRWSEIARRQAGDDYATTYAARFRANAEAGHDIHGEAHFVAALLDPLGPSGLPTSVLDAGCGTGRISIKLAAWGYDVIGSDVDEAMLGVARADAPDLTWVAADLATMRLGRSFDLVLLAGNIIPLLEPGTLGSVAETLAAHCSDDGLVVAGFGLDAAHLPAGCPPTPLAAYDAAMAAAGMRLHNRWSTWDRQPPEHDPGYAVSVYIKDS